MNRRELFTTPVAKPDAAILAAVKRRWDALSKPIDGLGDFENAICRIAAIQGTDRPTLARRAAVVMCADHGIVAEGVSQCGKEVTLAVAKALGARASSVSRLAALANVDVTPVDIGIDCEGPIPGVLDLKVARGSRNFLVEPALAEEEALLGVERGIALVERLAGEGYNAIASGEMGIGNTTPSTAIVCSLLKLYPGQYVGRGAGLDDEGFRRKKRVIESALEKHAADAKKYESDKDRAFKTLCEFGGLDVAGLVGVFIGGARFRVPIIVDGLVTAAAALCAERIAPGVREYMLASHSGREKGIDAVLNVLRLRPLISGNMALGEGTGAVMLFPLLDLALGFLETGSTFAEIDVAEYERFGKCSF